MNQFKDVFTGQRKVDYRRAASSQKCIRAGGKHNDLDNVGFTATHHTFFEMLGNFSFGDYFKEEAIFYGWEWITRELGLPTDRLYATVYETDDEAFQLWEKIAPELKKGRIQRFGKKDNYWSMGDVGPCGPCSEIHFDRGEKFGTGPDDILNGDTDRFVEIWNLVFMQFDQQPDGGIRDLPRPSVDTGAGLERIAAIMQQADSNYGIDIFSRIIDVLCHIAHSDYRANIASHHVIADHVRALTFAIADGAGISNEGQGYVLRRILRRAARHGRLLGMEEPFIYRLVATVVEQMGDAYPEIAEKQSHIENIVQVEEESFGRTLATGLDLFEKIVKSTKGKVIAGEDVFRLYDTYGFPYDLTEIMAAEKSMTLDMPGFEEAVRRQKELSKAASGFAETAQSNIKDLTDRLTQGGLERHPVTKFVRENLKIEANLLMIAHNSVPETAAVLDRTPFYVEAGGQASDTGSITGARFSMEVSSMFNYQGYYVHLGRITEGSLEDITAGKVTAEVLSGPRWDTMRNHTATHLAHAALRQVLGTHVRQSGSYVGPDRLRFDFSHHRPMMPEEIRKVEEIVNLQILTGTAVMTDVMDIDTAKASGAMALFGEKYDEKVRVVSVSGFSKELCGGTHVENVSQIGPFFITLETGVASGVRRLEALTGRAAIEYMLEDKIFREEATRIIGRSDDAIEGLEHLKQQNLLLQKELRRAKAEMFAGGQTVGSESVIGPVKLVTNDFGDTDRDVMAGWIDTVKQRKDPEIAAALGMIDGKLTFMMGSTVAAVRDHKIDVGAMAKVIVPPLGGRGGGKPAYAQGTIDPGKKDKFGPAVKKYLREKVG